jgi:hypothetical protein
MKSINLFYNFVNDRKLSLFDNLAPIKDAKLGGGGEPIGALKPPPSIIVVMNTYFISIIFFLKQISFHKTTFQPSFFKSLKKNTCVT